MTISDQMETRHKINVITTGIDLSILQRRSICIIGPSGVGKSTLAEAIERRTGARFRILPSVVTPPRANRCTDVCSCRPITAEEFDVWESAGLFFLYHRTAVGNMGIGLQTIRDALSHEAGVILVLRTHGGIHRYLPELPVIDLRAPVDVLAERIKLRGRPPLTSLPILLKVCEDDMACNERGRIAQSAQGFKKWYTIENAINEPPIAQSLIDQVIEIIMMKEAPYDSQ